VEGLAKVDAPLFRVCPLVARRHHHFDEFILGKNGQLLRGQAMASTRASVTSSAPTVLGWAAAPPQRRGVLSRKAQMTDLAELVLRELTRRALWERRLCHIFRSTAEKKTISDAVVQCRVHAAREQAATGRLWLRPHAPQEPGGTEAHGL